MAERYNHSLRFCKSRSHQARFLGSGRYKMWPQFIAISLEHSRPGLTVSGNLRSLLAAEKAESIAKRGLSFAELSHPEARHLERLLAGEIQWAMQKMFRQYDAIADLLLPADLVPKQSVVATNVATLSPQPELNFEER